VRILIVSNCYPPNFIGGAELVVHRHARRLQHAGHSVQVFAGDHSSAVERHHSWDEVFQEISIRRVRITHLDSDSRFTNFLNRPIADQFRKLLESWAPDVVSFHNTTGLSLSSFFHCRLARVPVVVTLHDHWGFCLKNTLINHAQEACRDFSDCARCLPAVLDPFSRQSTPIEARRHYFRRRLADVSRFITPSAYLAEKYIRAGFESHRFEVISNGIDPSQPTPHVASSTFRLTTICYLGSHKGVHVIIEALSRLPKSVDWRFNIVGTGHLESALRRLARIRGVQDRVHFWGRLPNEKISQVFAETDLYVLASTWAENEPVSILEAMTRGIPVVGTNIGGIPELVQPGINGWLVRVGSADELNSAIREAIADPAYLKRMSEGATRMGTRWPEVRQVTRISSVLEQAISDPAIGSVRPIVALTGNWQRAQYEQLFNIVGDAERTMDFLPASWIEPEESSAVIATLEPTLKSIAGAISIRSSKSGIAAVQSAQDTVVTPESARDSRRFLFKT
jgi:glycosyltransferase involved in cell wall biosynthesis